MKDRPCHRRNHRSAVVTGIALSRCISVMLALHLTVVAEGDVTGAALLHQPIEASIAIGKLSVELLNCVSPLCGNRLLYFHSDTSMAEILPAVKGYLPLADHCSPSHCKQGSYKEIPGGHPQREENKGGHRAQPLK